MLIFLHVCVGRWWSAVGIVATGQQYIHLYVFRFVFNFVCLTSSSHIMHYEFLRSEKLLHL